MKNKVVMVVMFLIAYLGFLIATLPATVVLKHVSLPKSLNNSVKLAGVSGSVWHTRIEQVIYQGTRIEKVDTRLNAWSLLSLTPTLAITFGDAFSTGPEGQLDLALSSDTAAISNLSLLVNANDIAQQLPLPLPMTAKGSVALNIATGVFDLNKANQCITTQGKATWSKAGVIALEQDVKLGALNADIGCDKGELTLAISPNNDLGLTFTAYVHKGGKVSGKGYLKPGANFPAPLVTNNAKMIHFSN